MYADREDVTRARVHASVSRSVPRTQGRLVARCINARGRRAPRFSASPQRPRYACTVRTSCLCAHVRSRLVSPPFHSFFRSRSRSRRPARCPRHLQTLTSAYSLLVNPCVHYGLISLGATAQFVTMACPHRLVSGIIIFVQDRAFAIDRGCSVASVRVLHHSRPRSRSVLGSEGHGRVGAVSVEPVLAPLLLVVVGPLVEAVSLVQCTSPHDKRARDANNLLSLFASGVCSANKRTAHMLTLTRCVVQEILGGLMEYAIYVPVAGT